MTDGDNEPEELRRAPAAGGDEKTVANSDAKVATGAGKPGKNWGGRMTPAEILTEADRTGITLRRTADSDRVLYRPEDAIGPELLAAIREQESELMPYLKPWGDRYCPSCGSGLQPNDADGEPCFTCRWPGATTRAAQ